MRKWFRILPVALTIVFVTAAMEADADDAGAIIAAISANRPAKIQPIEGDTTALNSFFAALSRTAAKKPGALTRVAHVGDSTIEMDLTPGPMRRLMAKSFGDGGRGFILMGRPKPWYRPYDVEFDPSSAWISEDCREFDVRDRRFGLGGAVLLAFKEKASTEFGTVKSGPVGTAVSRFEILYPVRPDGGTLEVKLDGKNAGTINAQGPDAEAYAVVTAAEGAHSIEVAAPAKNTRAYGVVMERGGPGVIYDALGVNGTGVPSWLSIKEEHWIEHLRHRSPDLVILALGTNDTAPDLDLTAYKKQVARLIGVVRKALPDASILWQAPLDRATKSGADLVTNPMLPRIVAAQREVATKEKVAFWSAFDAMGGEGSMARWYRSKPQLGAADLFHPTREGGEVIADMLYGALMVEFEKYLKTSGVSQTARPKPESALVRVELKP